MTEEIEDSKLNESLRSEAVKDVLDQRPDLAKTNPIDFIKEVGKKFIEKKLESFPMLCEIARFQNYMKWKELKETSNKGKYTDSYGWSKDGSFKFEYEIPNELYLFMVNLVYRDFWSQENSRVWRKFMKKICDGEDPMNSLMWAKTIYGNNMQEEAVVN